MRYQKLEEMFKERKETIRSDRDTAHLTTLCESILPLLLELRTKFAEKLITLNQTLDKRDALIAIDFENQIYSLLAAYELLQISLVSSSKGILRAILETLLRDMYCVYSNKREEIEKEIAEFLEIFNEDSALDDNEKEDRRKKWVSKYRFNTYKQGLYTQNSPTLEGMEKAYYEQLSPFSHGMPTGLYHNIKPNIAAIQDKLLLLLDLSFWIVLIFLKHFEGHLPIDSSIQKKLSLNFTELHSLTGGTIYLIPDHTGLNVSDTVDSLFTLLLKT